MFVLLFSQTATAYKSLRKKLIEDGLVAVISLPSEVFQPYSGVKTSILLFDNEVAKKADNLLFVKITNDGFDLGAQRREIDKNDLPTALEIIKKYRETLSDENFTEAEKEMAQAVARRKIAESGDYNLTGERYREVETFTNQKYPMVELGEVCDFIGKGQRPASFATKDGKIPFIVSSLELKKCNFADYDMEALIIGDGGSANIHYMNGKFSTSDHTYILKKKNNAELLLSYVYKFIRSNLNLIEKGFRGQGLKNVSKKYLQSIKIPLPPLSVQKEIVEKIEVKQKAIDAAKEVIRNLERERAYFGASLRRIEGIEWVELGEVAEVIAGQSPEGKYYNENGEGIPFYQGKTEFTEIYLGKPKKWTSKITKVAERNDILMSVRAPVGPVNIATEKICIGRGIASIRAKEIDKMFLFYFLKSIEDKIRGGGGAVFDSINKKQIEEIKIPLPSLEIQQKLVAEAEEEQKIIDVNKKLIEIMEGKIEANIKFIYG